MLIRLSDSFPEPLGLGSTHEVLGEATSAGASVALPGACQRWARQDHGIPWDTMASWNLLLSTYDRLCFSRSKLLDIGYWLGTAKFDGLKSLEHFRYFRTSFAHSLTAINWVQNPRFWFETSLLRAAPRKVQTKAADFTKILLQPCRLWHVLQWLKHVKTNERFRTENWESTINPPISIDQDRWDRRYRWGAVGVVCLRCISMATVVFVSKFEGTVRDMILYLNVGIYIHGKQPHFDVKAMVFNWVWHIPSIYQ